MPEKKAITVLKDIESVDWAGLTHAFGSAADVPALIRDLASSDKAVRDEAYGELHGNIWHQGTAYEATPHAVPFLLELLAADSTDDKPHLLFLLASLAGGSSYLEVHRHSSAYAGECDTPEFQRKLAIEREWVHSTLAAVRRGIPLFVNHLRHPEPEVRAFAAHLLSQCQDNSVIEILVHLLDVETEPCVLASILFALSDLGLGDSIIVFNYLDHTDLGVRFAAAICVVKGMPRGAPRKAIDLLVDVVIGYDLLDPYETLPYAADHPLISVASNTLAALGPEVAGFVAPRLMDALPAIPGPALDEPIEALLGVTFTPSQSLISCQSLTEAQRVALNTLATTSAAWQFSFQLIRADQLGKYGLPQDRDGLRRFLDQRRRN